LNPGRELLKDNQLWQHQSAGLVFFRSQHVSQLYRVNLDLQELVVVNRRFHIKPLLSLLRDSGQFYLLSLDLGQMRLYKCTRDQMDEIDLAGYKNIPESLPDALQFDDPERQLQFHTGTGGSAGERGAMYHGQGKGVDKDNAEHKKNIVRFFQQFDKGFSAFLKDHNTPLVLAGVGYLLPLFREASNYPRLVDAGISHNPDELNQKDLHAKAWDLVRGLFQKAEKKAADKYRRLSGSQQTSNRIEEAVPASHHKRIESLFVRQAQQVWGTFENDMERIEIHKHPESGDEDLLDLAAVQTFINGGNVFVVPEDHMPDESELAAVYRY
jgi:hypothetical protein